MIISSAMQRTPLRPSDAWCSLFWKISLLPVRAKGRRQHGYLSHRVANVVSSQVHSDGNLIWGHKRKKRKLERALVRCLPGKKECNAHALALCWEVLVSADPDTRFLFSNRHSTNPISTFVNKQNDSSSNKSLKFSFDCFLPEFRHRGKYLAFLLMQLEIAEHRGDQR